MLKGYRNKLQKTKRTRTVKSPAAVGISPACDEGYHCGNPDPFMRCDDPDCTCRCHRRTKHQ